jgi:TPP-dependent pyruvate/acetoin dehydrogenase alpha subunit
MSPVELITPLATIGSGGDSASSADEAGLARKLWRYMALMREAEDRIERKLYRQGKIVGGVYVGRGQEAIPVGTAVHATPDDVLLPSHRDMALFLIRGVPMGRVFAQYLGRVDGPSHGRDGNMHMGDLKLNIISIISAMAASVPVATGAALALRYQHKNGVAFCYFGDGATSRGDWHEGLNFAAVQKLPIVFICNNNQYAYSTPLNKQMAVENVADRGAAYGMASEIVDGNDVLAVYRAAERAIAFARSGHGPFLLECKTFRMTGHAAHDGAEYVPKDLWEQWGKLDPITRLETHMREKAWVSEPELETLHAGVRQEVDEAVEWAEKSPYPDPATLQDNVYED